MADLNVTLVNPTFDGDAVGWTGLGAGTWEYDGTEGHTTAGSGKYIHGTNGLKQFVTVAGGGRYTLTAWVKTVDLVMATSGVCIKLVIYTHPAAVDVSVTELYSTYVKGTTVNVPENGFVQLTITTPFIPVVAGVTGDPIVKFAVYAQPSGEVTSGVAYFDDFVLTQIDDTKFDPLILNPNYRGQMYSDETLKLGYNLWANPIHPLDKLSVVASVTDPEGTVNSISSTPSYNTSDITIYGVNKMTDLSLSTRRFGSYSVKFDLFDSDVSESVPIETETHTFEKLPYNTTKPTVYGDTKNRTVDTNNPKFLLGAFYGNVTNATTRNADFLQMQEMGLNSIIASFTTDVSTFALLDTYLANCASAGLRVVFGLWHTLSSTTSPITYYPRTGDKIWNTASEVRQGLVNYYKNNPAILAWYIADERTATDVPEITTAYNEVRYLDPNHPVLINTQQYDPTGIMDYDEESLFHNICDIMSTDSYPIKGGQLIARVGYAASNLRLGTQESRPTWMIIEAPIPSTAVPDRPTITAAQILCEAYQAICLGVRGIFFYEWSEMEGVTGSSGETAADRIAILTSAVSDLTAIKDMVVADNASIQTTCDSASIKLVTRMWNGEPWILVVNPTASTVTAPKYTVGAYGMNKAALGLPGAAPTATYDVTTDFTAADIAAGGTAVYRLYSDATPPTYTKKNTFDNNAMNKTLLGW